MQTKLISITKPVSSETINLNPEELIVYIARVSNPSNQLNTETSDKLISYLIKNKHWSPFEHVSFTVEIVTSRAISAQILRHRSFKFQEFSQRYSEVTEFENIDLRLQADKNRQSSTDNLPQLRNFYFQDRIRIIKQACEELYKEMLENNIAKEVARFILPLTTQTKIYMTGDVRSWIHYLQIRCDSHTQKEHQLIALEIKDIFESLFPNISKSLNENE